MGVGGVGRGGSWGEVRLEENLSNQLVVIQRWSAYTVGPVYSGHP